MMVEPIKYFAYGSNLEPVQMQRRCPDSQPIQNAIAPGLRLTFPVRSEGDWGGGVASLEPIAGDGRDGLAHEPQAQDQHAGGVWGVVFEISEADRDALDRYEAVAEGMYVRANVRLASGPGAEAREHFLALTYLAVRGFNTPGPPTRRYLDALLAGAEHHGLPASYRASLAAIACVEERPNGSG